MKLRKTPSVAEINARYKHQWFRYMVDLHAQYIGKVARIFKEEAPQIQFHLCSDNLSSGAEPVSAWCGVDVRLSDSVVDGHMHMPYYAGIKFFDDVKFNILSLKKPFFPLIDPAECLLSFYRQYTPDKVRQNILAVAALGGKGIGFWPDDAFTGDYHKVISEAYAMISGHEDFYAAGERCEREYRFTPVNAVAGKITNENGKEFTVYFPDFPRVLRTTVHRWNGEELFTLFNYHEQLPLLLEIRGNSRLYYAEIPPNGVVLLRSSDLRNQERLRRRAEEIRKKIAPDAGKLPELRKGKSALEWCAGSQGEPLFRLSNGTIQATVDVLGDGRIREIFNSSHAPLLNSGFLNRLMFYDTHQQPVSWKLSDLKIEQDIPEITLHGTVPPYAGANPQENPLMGLQLSFRYALSGETLLVDFKLRNPTAKSMKIGFRLNNYPKPGARFDTEKVQTVIRSENRMIPVDPLHENFLRQGETCSFFNGKSPLRWDGGRIFIFAEKGALSDEMAILPDKSFAGIYCWFGNKAQTVELLSPDFELAPGMEKIFRYQVELAPGNRKR